MAKIISPVWSIIRGSIGVTTYSANQYGQIIGKSKIASAQLPSARQTRVNVAFAQAALAWRNLSEANRTAWANYALTVPFTSATGSYTVSGRSLFIGTRSWILFLNAQFAAGIPIVDPPPNLAGRFAVNNVASAPRTVSGIGFLVVINNSTDRDITYQIDIAGPFTQSRNKWNGPWDASRSISGSVAAGSFLLASVDALTLGMFYFWRFRATTKTTGTFTGNALTNVWTGRQIANFIA